MDSLFVDRAPDARGSDRWELDYLFAVGVRNWLIHAAVVALTWAVLAAAPSGFRLGLAWIAVMLGLSSAMAALSYAYVRIEPRPLSAATFATIHTALTGLVGLSWGLGAFGITNIDQQYFLFYSLAVGGTALGAISSQHSSIRSCLVSIWTSIPLLAAAHLLNDESVQGAAQSGLVLLYAAALTIFAQRIHGFLRDRIRLSSQLELKLEELTQTSQALERARKEAEAANLSKSRLMAQASHDLRQSVHAIGLFVACLREERLDEGAFELIDHIDRSVDTLAQQFRSLLDMSAIESGRVHPRIEPVALDEAIEAVVQQLEKVARGRDVHIRRVSTQAVVATDLALLKTILQNLLSNAIKYGRGGDVLVGVRRSGNTYAIQIVDQGVGIAADDVNLAFEEFVRLPQARQMGVEGFGLGLAIAARLASILDLSISLRSVRDCGTLASVSGLLVSSDSAPKPVHRSESPLLDGLRVLAVDDDEEVLSGTVQLLERWGCRVVANTKMPATLPEIDVLLIDQDLGSGQSGFDILTGLRRSGAVTIGIVIAGNAAPSLAEQAAANKVILLTKPMRPAQLRSALLSARVGAGGRHPRAS